MRTIKHTSLIILGIGVVFGIGIAITFVNPYLGKITLSELVLQISGSRGEFELSFGIDQLLGLTIRLIPTFIFELYVGTELYHYFCTASIYIFSRVPNRLRWYWNQMSVIVLLAVIYQAALMVGTVLATMLRYQVEFNAAGLLICLYHIILYTLWTLSLTILVNLLAVLLDSSTSFMIVAGTQLVLIALLSLMRLFQENADLIARLIGFNPISHLILGWHSSRIEGLNQALHSPYGGLGLCSSLLFMAVFCGICMLGGAIFVKRHDLLISNSETEVS